MKKKNRCVFTQPLDVRKVATCQARGQHSVGMYICVIPSTVSTCQVKLHLLDFCLSYSSSRHRRLVGRMWIASCLSKKLSERSSSWHGDRESGKPLWWVALKCTGAEQVNARWPSHLSYALRKLETLPSFPHAHVTHQSC